MRAAPKPGATKTHRSLAACLPHDLRRHAQPAFHLRGQDGPVVRQGEERIAQGFVVESVAAGFVSGIAHAPDHFGIRLRRVPGPEKRRADAVLLQKLQQMRRAVFHAFIERSEGANVGLHVEPEHDIEGASRAARRPSLCLDLVHGRQSAHRSASIFLLNGTGPLAVIS